MLSIINRQLTSTLYDTAYMIIVDRIMVNAKGYVSNLFVTVLDVRYVDDLNFGTSTMNVNAIPLLGIEKELPTLTIIKF